MFEIILSDRAQKKLDALKANPSQKKRYNAVAKTLRHLAADPKHPGLHTHPYQSLEKQLGQKVFESYAEQKTPAAYRVFWYYGPSKDEITIIAITPHP
ncbi:hypothetical protein M1N87_00030 [Dehalococcoidia bacterium]|nr:hypothetical protein [Dehalococcoidia bacterium]MCL0065252.1 hypothetical protein [Dehalococcoidia bacterium]MCL0088210.1 hypothetical protein [Dehalococcoidia bacterium]